MIYAQPEIARQILSISAASLFCLAPVGAQAQLEPTTQLGSRIPVKPEAMDPVRAGVVKKGFARCLYERNSAKAPILLENSDPMSLDYSKVEMPDDNIGKYLGMANCLGDQADGTQSAIGFRFSPSQLRAMLQEESYLAANRKAPTLPSGSEELVQRDYVSQGDKLHTARSLGAFADCLTFRDTRNADAILRTTPGSKNEMAAATALAPTLGACLTEGQSLSLTPSSIRGFVADGLWNRYVRNAKPTAVEVNEKP